MSNRVFDYEDEETYEDPSVWGFLCELFVALAIVGLFFVMLWAAFAWV